MDLSKLSDSDLQAIQRGDLRMMSADGLKILAGEPKKEAVQTAGEFLTGIPRQLGLTARAGIQGLGGAVGVLSDPIASAINLARIGAGRDAAVPTARKTAQNVADFIGLPTPETPTERVAGGTAELMAGAGGGMGFGQLLARGAPMVASEAATFADKALAASRGAGQFLSQAPAVQVSSAAGGGMAGGSVKEAGGGPGAEFAAALLGSVAGGAAPGALDRTMQAGARLMTPKLTAQEIDVKIQQALTNQGVDWEAMPKAVRFSLRNELSKTLQAGDEISPEALRRLADFKTIGATPTRGMVTLDPVQITREKNLSKMAANSGQDELYGLPRIENQNNRTLIDTLNTVRGKPVDAFTAGERAIGTLGAKDARYSAVENTLYERARGAAGRDIPLDREAFLRTAYENLAKQNKGAFLPAEIDGLLRQIREGKAVIGGQDYPIPFNVDVIDNLKTTLAAASRSSKDGNTRSAIAQVRNALESVQPAGAPIKTAFGGNAVATGAQAAAMQQADALPAEAMKAFDRARSVARMRRTWQESAPSIKATMDDVAPDQFVQKFVLSPSASADDVSALARELKRNPEAAQSMRSAIVEHLKEKALSGASDEVGKFSQSAYNKALGALDRKLPSFFSREEIAQMEAAGRVASYMQVQPVGSAVNNSNSGAMVLGRALDGIAGISRFLPLGRGLVADPLQSLQLSIGTRNAQNVSGGLLAPRQPAPMLTGSALLPAVMATGLLSSP
jgi:hypothetical protein